jgi:hypothetical protein
MVFCIYTKIIILEGPDREVWSAFAPLLFYFWLHTLMNIYNIWNTKHKVSGALFIAFSYTRKNEKILEIYKQILLMILQVMIVSYSCYFPNYNILRKICCYSATCQQAPQEECLCQILSLYSHFVSFYSRLFTLDCNILSLKTVNYWRGSSSSSPAQQSCEVYFGVPYNSSPLQAISGLRPPMSYPLTFNVTFDVVKPSPPWTPSPSSIFHFFHVRSFYAFCYYSSFQYVLAIIFSNTSQNSLLSSSPVNSSIFLIVLILQFPSIHIGPNIGVTTLG